MILTPVFSFLEFNVKGRRRKLAGVHECLWSLQRTLDSHVILAVDILVVQWNLRFNSRYLFLLLWMMSTKIRYVLKMHSSFSFAITMLRKVNTKTKKWIQVVTVNRNGPIKYSSKTWSWRLLRPVWILFYLMGTKLLKATFHVYALFDTRTFAKYITLFKFFVSLLLIIFLKFL